MSAEQGVRQSGVAVEELRRLRESSTVGSLSGCGALPESTQSPKHCWSISIVLPRLDVPRIHHFLVRLLPVRRLGLRTARHENGVRGRAAPLQPSRPGARPRGLARKLIGLYRGKETVLSFPVYTCIVMVGAQRYRGNVRIACHN